MISRPFNTLAKVALVLPLGAQAASWWTPSAGLSWQIVLSESIKPLADVAAIDGDLFGTDAATWGDLKSSGRSGICYFSAGSSENWRPDFKEFNSSDIGEPLDGWPGEKWLNTKSDNVRRIMMARMDMAVQKGCTAVDPDNTDVYDNGGGGFDLTTSDAVDYVKFLASEGHKRGLAVGLKNSGKIVDDVVNTVDFQVNEQCVEYEECDVFQPFIKAGKPVFGIEYVKGTPSDSKVDKICNDSSRKGMSTLIKHMDLGQFVVACPGQQKWTPGTISHATNSTANSTVPTNSSSSPSPAPTADDNAAVSSAQISGALVLALACFWQCLFL